jgi:hypothetical protein
MTTERHDHHPAGYHGYEGEERRLPHWWDKWVNPTTVLAMIGGVVWGIQLNMAVIDHTQKIGKIANTLAQQQTLLQTQSNSLARVTVILDTMERRITGTEAAIKTDAVEVGQIKGMIISNQERIRALDHPKNR